MAEIALSGKRVIVTGAGGGLGRAFALAFADAGAQVIAADINLPGAEETAALIGGDAVAARVDVTQAESCREVVAQAVSRLGGLDVLVNNAALYGGLQRAPFEEIDEAVWDRVMAVNVKGVWQMTRAASAALRATGNASVINIASATVFSGSPLWMHYVTSKGALIAMTRTMAREMGRDGVRVNAIAPGFTLTEASLDLIDNARHYGVDRASLKRNAEVDDITGGALYLASSLAGFVTGQTLVIDGGKQFI
ncbi:MAG: SDR family oxidoreductase [Rhodobacter sp.]|nr:SDR family oxidoreductase [Paracoccaceae bacterium]MCB1408400.1 SDR family oxidoreductase [Paracoccaceae bacterium]MCC0078985.1 SDR family oxidoreductase [Rhodobacter sp.]